LSAYCETLLTAFPPAQEKTAISATPQKASLLLLEPLTEREQQVLERVAAGFTNQQICDSLVISLGTTKKHLANIFGKLQVNTRTQALIRARELGLIS
jgi:ATP/maltotriose-dependent transcriptional regulator MalT